MLNISHIYVFNYEIILKNFYQKSSVFCIIKIHRKRRRKKVKRDIPPVYASLPLRSQILQSQQG
jgi:hypothetical protein